MVSPRLQVNFHYLVPITLNGLQVLAPFTPFAKDKGILTGAVTLYMQTRKADFLRGGFYSVNWDLNEMEEHQEEILEKKLLKLAFINAELQAGGYQWST